MRKANQGKMIFPALLCLLLTNLVGVSSQQTDCTREGFQAIAVERVFDSAASEATDPSDIFINATYYNCLATSETIGEYTTMSVSLLYTILSAPGTLHEIRYVMLCIGGIWNRQTENNTALRRNDTRTDCYECTDTANNVDYCSPCDSSCTGLNQCYGPNATQCCSYNDGGNCVADCGMNREGNATFQCVCSNFWTGANCDVCDLNCTNGGTQQSDCSACQCVPGYNGTLCDINIDECSPNPCQNGGRCTDLINDYNCTCNPVYSGRNCSGCAIPNCEQCKESSQNVTGECTKCAGAFVLNNGTCNDNCGILKCIRCDKNMKCTLCEEGYAEDNGKCFGEKPDEEGQDNDGLGVGAIIGIIVACVVTALLILILATSAAFHRKKLLCNRNINIVHVEHCKNEHAHM